MEATQGARPTEWGAVRPNPPRVGRAGPWSDKDEALRLDTDPYLERYAARVQGMSASEIRALFSVASRPEIVSFAGGMPNTASLDLEAVEHLAAQLLREEGATALQYGAGQGRVELRELIVEVMRHEGVPAHADDLVVTVGGQQALELIAKCFVDAGDIVVAEGPTYVGGIGALSSHQADVRHVPMDDDGMRVDELEDLLIELAGQGRRPKFVYTVPNHQNPAGVSMSVERRHRLAELAETHDLLILEDNPYGLLDFDGRTWPSLRELVPERVIYVGTMSKTFAPGVRTGWVAAPAPVRDKLILLREAADLCPSSFTQMLLERWLSTQPWQEQVKRFRAVYHERAEVMLTGLEAEMPEGVHWTVPAGGFYIWLTVPPGIDTSDLLAKAINHRVAYVPGRGFYADGSGGDQMRLCFSYPPVERIREGIVRLGELLHTELELVQAVYGDQVPTTRRRTRDEPGPPRGG
jgi:2-aminoadipate transaminase